MGKIFKALEKSKKESLEEGAGEKLSPPGEGAAQAPHEEPVKVVMGTEGGGNGADGGAGTAVLPDTSPAGSPAAEETPAAGPAGNGEAEGRIPDPAAPEANGEVAARAGGNGSRERSFEMDRNLVTLFKPKSAEAEQFRILKTKILFPEKGDPPRSIMVTSAVPGEGKTFVASNLAISIAQSVDDYVLLMDCDMRLSSVHTRFGFDPLPGLSDYLTGRHPLASLLVKTEVDKLTILPGGTPPDNPSELLSSEQMAALFDEVKGRYSDRYIIVDSPPPQLTAESRALARRVDGIILVVKQGTTPREQVGELLDILGREKILGVLFNHFSADSLSGYKYGGYSPYGKYYGR